MDTPHIKFEHSPADSLADSFVSTPGSHYPPLFDPSETMDLSEAMTPPFDTDSMFDQSMSGSVAGTPAPEKKAVKKRKSWGQQLPEPKTNLPPRKRAKTEDEKEQRRVERVLRNRRAAQSSRERKRQEVEALEAEKRTIERRNQDLELRLADSEAKRVALEQQIARITGNMTVFNQSSPAPQTEQYRQAPSPITLSKELFSSRDGHDTSFQQPVTDAHRNLQSSIQTVNPASISPEMRPVAESNSNASSSDMTQHPAVSVGRTTALDGFNHEQHFDLSHHGLANADFGNYLDFPATSISDSQFLENGILPITDAFNLEYDNMVSNHTEFIEDFNINEFLNHDNDSAQCAPHEYQPENELAQKTAHLQPPIGASLDGCDDGRLAVSV